MADTFIYAITQTGENSMHYDTEDKAAKIIGAKKDGADSLAYVMRDKKGNFHNLSAEYLEKIKDYVSVDKEGQYTFRTISSYLNCSNEHTYEQWEKVRAFKNPERGNTGNIQYCIVQNFGEEFVDPKTANEIGVRFAQEFLGGRYQCVISTHVNTGLVHNHIEFNSTSFIDGKKFDDRLSNIYDIREISDRLCREYGLAVMEATTKENARVVVYRDAQGKVHYFEPTERKTNGTEKVFANANDYRNYEQYQQGEIYEKSHRDILKESIDNMLPYAASYEDLLDMLNSAGYEIKAKTKTGEWRKHISFKAETWDKFVRDGQIGKVYGRLSLTAKIEENVKGGKVLPKENMQLTQADIFLTGKYTNADIYEYGRIIIDEIDDNYRYRKKAGGFIKVQRSDVEKYIISDTKEMNREINAALRLAAQPHREFKKAESRGEYLIGRINSNLRTLRFVEDRNIQSISQLNDIVKSLYEQRNACYGQMERISKALKVANTGVVLIDKYNELKSKIAQNTTNPDYVLYEREDDISVLKSLENSLKEKKLLEPESQRAFKENYNKYNNSFKQLSTALEKVNGDIQKYDDCVFNINLVDKKNDNRYAAQIENYYSTKKTYAIGTRNQTEEERKNEKEERS